VTYPLGAGLRWTPFDFGAIRSRVRASEARAQGSLASYEQTVATTLAVYGALSGFADCCRGQATSRAVSGS
jgi:multidrug efflux system outer membrane protein